MLCLESTILFLVSLLIDNFSNGFFRDLQSSIPLDEESNGHSANDYSYTVDSKDYSDISYLGNNDFNKEEYTENSYSSGLAETRREMSPKENDYSMLYGQDLSTPLFSPQNENFGEEISIEDCDKEIQLSDGTWFYFVYKDLNKTRCMCHYSNYKDPEMMPGYDCSVVSDRGKRHLFTAPDQDYKNAFSCKARLDVKAAHSTQVFIYKKLTWENWHFRRTCYCIYEKKNDPIITIKRMCDNCKHWRGLPRPQSKEFRHYKWCPMEP